MEINQFVAVTDDPEFFLETTLLYIDTRNIRGLSGRVETCLLDYRSQERYRTNLAEWTYCSV